METDEHRKIYHMKLWATNEVHAKSKFWYFLGKLKKVKKINYLVGINIFINLHFTFHSSTTPICARQAQYDIGSLYTIKS
ncbi:hypothetical protein LguiA_017598 [Lonicera macranthoides]